MKMLIQDYFNIGSQNKASTRSVSLKNELAWKQVLEKAYSEQLAQSTHNVKSGQYKSSNQVVDGQHPQSQSPQTLTSQQGRVQVQQTNASTPHASTTKASALSRHTAQVISQNAVLAGVDKPTLFANESRSARVEFTQSRYSVQRSALMYLQQLSRPMSFVHVAMGSEGLLHLALRVENKDSARGMLILNQVQKKLQHMGYMIESVKLNGHVIDDKQINN